MHRSRAARPPVRAAAWLGVLLLHALLLSLLAQSGKARRELAPRAPLPRISVRLLPPTDGAPSSAVATRAPLKPDLVTRAAIPRDARTWSPPMSTGPSAITLGSREAAPQPGPEASQAQAPLDLTVRHGAATPPSLREQMLADPRANSRGTTPEARMAQALGDARLSEENLGDGRWRFRQNGQCLESRPSRAGQLDPYANVPRPNLIGACY